MRTAPPRSQAELAALHADPEYFHHPYFTERRELGREASRAKYRRILGMLANGSSARGTRLLDVGCDTGGLLVVARDEFGMDVTGVEVSGSAADVAQKTHDLDVVTGEVTEVNLPAASFDLITMVDVIEHVADPAGLLARAHDLLREGGRLYIGTGDHDALINSLGLTAYRLAGRWSLPILEKLYIPYHEFYFNRATLARLVNRLGFRIIYHGSTEFPLDEFGHGLLWKLGLIPIFACQHIFGRKTLQQLIAARED